MTDTALESLLERLLDGAPLTQADRDALFETRDLLTLGMAADELRRRRHGSRITFVRVATIEAAAALSGDVRWSGSPGELCLAGSAEPIDAAISAVRHTVAASGGIPVTGFSLADLEAAAAASGEALVNVLRRLREAGLAAIASAPLDAVRDPDAGVTAAEEAGLPIARLTIERLGTGDRERLLMTAAALVESHPGLRVFAPLPRRLAAATPSTGYEDVQLVALARLLVPVDHIQVDWALYGPKLAQVALAFGADDVDAVSPLDEVPEGRRRAPLEEIRRNIVAASAEPVERDALFAVRSAPGSAA
ncbi:MAG TPA: hypothetical protein VIL25_08705 [Vicinamibacterales bacterium]